MNTTAQERVSGPGPGPGPVPGPGLGRDQY